MPFSFESLDEARLRVLRLRLREFLLFSIASMLSVSPLTAGSIVTSLDAERVDAAPAVEGYDDAGLLHLIARRAAHEVRACDDGVFHLARYEAAPYQLVELVLLGREVWLHRFGRQRRVGRAYRLVRVLRLALRRVFVGRRGQIFLAEALAYKRARSFERFWREAQAVGAHIGDEPRRAAARNFDAPRKAPALCASCGAARSRSGAKPPAGACWSLKGGFG